jgi:ribokinase
LPIEDALHWGSLYAALSVRVPTGAAGASALGAFIEEGSRRGLSLPAA